MTDPAAPSVSGDGKTANGDKLTFTAKYNGSQSTPQGSLHARFDSIGVDLQAVSYDYYRTLDGFGDPSSFEIQGLATVNSFPMQLFFMRASEDGSFILATNGFSYQGVLDKGKIVIKR